MILIDPNTKEKIGTVEKSIRHGGISLRFRFNNGFGASVIRNKWSYGGDEGLFELAVLKFDDDPDSKGNLCYNTKITYDVLGYLTKADVIKTLIEINNLPKDHFYEWTDDYYDE